MYEKVGAEQSPVEQRGECHRPCEEAKADARGGTGADMDGCRDIRDGER